MSDLVDVWRGLWRSSHAAAKLAFVMALATAVYYILFGAATAGVTAYQDSRHPLEGAGMIMQGLISGLTLAASLSIAEVAIGLALRSGSALIRLIGSLASLVPAAVASGFVFQTLGLIESDPPLYGVDQILETMLWVPFVVIGVAFIFVALLGFVDVARGGTSRRGAVRAHTTS